MIQHTIIKSNIVDKIFEDFLEDNFVNIFKPVFNIQQVLGVLRINIENGFVTPPTRRFKIYSCVIWLVNSMCMMNTVIYCSTRFDYLSTDIPLKVGMLLNGVVNTGIVWNNIFFSGHSNCQLYVKLQRIERSLKMKNAKHFNKKLFNMSLLFALSLAVLSIIWMVMFNKYAMKDVCPTATVASYLSSACCLEIFHIITIIYFISLRVQYINEMLKPNKLEKKISFSNFLTTDISDKIGGELVNGMFDILESFADTMDIYQHAIFVFTFQLLAWQLIPMQNLVVSYKKQMSINIISFLCTLPSSLVFMAFMLMLCFVSQSLTTKLEKCIELCITLVSSLDEGESRQNVKRIILLLRGKRAATVFDIFTLNTGLPFHLLAITASYTIVVLQFAAL